MIQAPLPKPVELPKAQPKKADAEVVSNIKSAHKPKSREVESSSKKSDENEFSKELEAKVSGEENVKPVKVTAEQALELPSELVNQQGSVDTTSPKIFDPALTKGVEDLIQPKTSEVAPMTDAEVLALANGEAVAQPEEVKAEIANALLKTPQAKDGGRAPAIEFAKSEIDPQLLNNEDFVAQKNLASKKAVTNAYGMKVVPQQQKLALEAGLKQEQVIKEVSANESAMNSQQFILGLQSEQKSLQMNEAQAAPKTFDMSNIKSSNPTEIMNQITDYVVQAKAAKEPTVNMRVNHEDLGMLDITVTKTGVGQENIAISIGAHTVDGKNFFTQNSKDLFSHMTSAGLNVTDLKVDTPSQTAKNDFDFGSQAGKNQQGSEKQFGSEQNQRRHEQERRQDLWKLLNQEAA